MVQPTEKGLASALTLYNKQTWPPPELGVYRNRFSCHKARWSHLPAHLPDTSKQFYLKCILWPSSDADSLACALQNWDGLRRGAGASLSTGDIAAMYEVRHSTAHAAPAVRCMAAAWVAQLCLHCLICCTSSAVNASAQGEHGCGLSAWHGSDQQFAEYGCKSPFLTASPHFNGQGLGMHSTSPLA